MKRVFVFFIAVALLGSCSNSTQKPANTPEATDEIGLNQLVIENDMEYPAKLAAPWTNLNTVVKMSDVKAHSGNFASKVNAEGQLSIGIRDEFRNINEKLPTKIIVSGWFYLVEKNDKIGIVLDVQENGQSYMWKPYKFEDTPVNQWTEFTAYFTIDKPIKPEMLLKIYGNGLKKEAYFDDMKIVFEY